jgi:outer membrane protein assembly factor BamB
MTVFARMGSLLLLAALALPARAAPAPYAVKPDWWDSTVPRAAPVSQLTNPAVAWEILSATNSPWLHPLEGWRVAGPFERAGGAAMEAMLPPEKGIARAAMPGKGGAMVEWQEWKAGQPCPLPDEFRDSIVYAFHLLRITEPTQAALVLEASGRCRAWLDGRSVISAARSNETTAVAVTLAPGPHQLLLKLEVPAGKWAFRAALAPQLPDPVEIRCRTVVAQRWPDSTNVVETHGIAIARLYAGLGDAVNFRFWAARVLALQRDPARLPVLAATWGPALAGRPELLAAQGAALRDGLLAARDNPPLRDALGAVLLKTLTLDDADGVIRIFRAAGYQPPPAVAAQFLSQCVLSNRTATLPYWLEQYVQREPNASQAADFLRPLQAKSDDIPRQALLDGLEEALDGLAAERAGPYVRLCAEAAVSRGDSARLDRILERDDGAARRALPFEAALWELEVARADLDQDRARAALAAAARARPAYTNTPEFERLRGEVFKMRAGTARPGAVLNDPDDAVQTIARFARQGETARLHSYMRRMLAERGHYLIADATDNNLYTSAKTLYRSLFAPYAEPYQAFLAREALDLAAKPGLAAESSRLLRLAALTPPAPGPAPAAAAPRAAAQISLPQGVFGALFDLPPGTAEVCGEESRAAFLGAWQPVLAGSGTDLDGVLVVQNSRGIAAVAGGALRWSYGTPACAAALNRFAMGYSGACRPARAGGIVAARLETAPGRFELLGFDVRSGVVAWRWRGAGEEPVGSPAVWRGTRLLVPALRGGAGERELSLVVLDAATGRELWRLTLCAASHVVMRSQVSSGAMLCHFRALPAPAVVGDSAYIDTGLGMVCAVDLLDECVRWARLYQRKFGEPGGGMRVAVSPIAGARNVLFAPVDSRWVMLVDRQTGTLVQRRTDLAWTSLGRCGPDGVLVTTPTSLQVLPLDGSEPGRSMDYARLIHVAALADGCLVAGGGELVVLDAQGRMLRRAGVAPGAVPVCMDAEGRWWGWGGLDGSTWGRLDDTVARQPLRLPAASAGGGPVAQFGLSARAYEADWPPAADGACRLSQNLLTRVNADGRVRWEIPVPPETAVLECGRRLIANFRKRVWVLDDADGRVVGVWPPLLHATNAPAVFRISTRGTQVFAAAAVPGAQGRTRIWDLGEEGCMLPVAVTDLPVWPGLLADFWVAGTAVQTHVVARAPGDRDVQIFRVPRPETPRAAPPADAVVEVQWGRASAAAVWYDRLRRQAVIFVRSPAETVRLGPAGLIRQPFPGVSELWNGAAYGWGDCMAFLHERDGNVRIVDPAGGGSVVLGLRPDAKAERPAFPLAGLIGGELFGLQSLGTNRLMVYRQNLAGAGVADGAAVRAVLTGGPAPLADDPWRGAVPLGDGRTLLLTARRIERDDFLRGCIWTPGSDLLQSVLLPGAAAPPQQIASNLWNWGDACLTAADWARVAALDRQVRPLAWTNQYAAGDSFQADGFLDDWAEPEFLPIPQGRLAVRRPGGRGDGFRVALEITNQAAVAAVAAAADFPGCCRLWAGRGDATACDLQRTQVLPLSHDQVMGEGHLVRRCAWQVTPDSRRCTVEFELAIPAVPARGAGEEPAERLRHMGDLALRATLDDPLQGSVDLAGDTGAGVAGFIRLRLP